MIFFVVKKKFRPPPAVDPQLINQFAMFMESGIIPELRSVIISHIYGTNIPEMYRDCQEQWEEMATLRDEKLYNSEYFANQV